jgi:actin-related protein
VNTEVQEDILDYTFYMLGFSGKSLINHPIIITEPLCNPNYSRYCELFVNNRECTIILCIVLCTLLLLLFQKFQN